jgi:hypothetical protein
LVPPLTSTLLGSVEKSRSGIAAGVLNSTRQTGSVLGVALFGALAGEGSAFTAGTHAALVISACLLLVAAAAIWRGASTWGAYWLMATVPIPDRLKLHRSAMRERKLDPPVLASLQHFSYL